MQFPRGPVTNALVVINLLIAAILLIPSWWQYAVISGGLFPVRLISGSAGVNRADQVLLRDYLLSVDMLKQLDQALKKSIKESVNQNESWERGVGPT